MTGLIRASGMAGTALLAFVSAPTWALSANPAAFTTTAALNQAQIVASQPAAPLAPVVLASADIVPAISALTSVVPAAVATTPVLTSAAAPTAEVPTVNAPSPVTAGSALARSAPAPTEIAKASASEPGFIARTVSATVSAVAAIPGKLGGLITGMLSSDTKDDEHKCLATAVYYESKGEPLEGQLAVAEVVLNRAASGKYPASACGVVKQRSQFSFVRRGGRLPTPPQSSAAWQRAVAVAEVAREKLADSVAANAMSFHATYVAPAWRRGLTRIARIGAHIFYR